MAGNAPREAPDCTPRVPRVRTSTATCGLATFRLTQSAVTCAQHTANRLLLRNRECASNVTSSSPRGASDRRQPFTYVLGRSRSPTAAPRAATKYVRTYIRLCTYAQHWYVRYCEIVNAHGASHLQPHAWRWTDGTYVRSPALAAARFGFENSLRTSVFLFLSLIPRSRRGRR